MCYISIEPPTTASAFLQGQHTDALTGASVLLSAQCAGGVTNCKEKNASPHADLAERLSAAAIHSADAGRAVVADDLAEDVPAHLKVFVGTPNFWAERLVV